MEMAIFLLLSLNKISLIGFFITLIFLLYQIHLLMTEMKTKKTKLVIPEFKETTIEPTLASKNPVAEKNKKNIYYRSNLTNIVAGVILLIVFGLIVLVGLTQKQKQESSDLITPTPIINIVASAGIKIYNENWVEIPDKELAKLKSGTKIIMGMEMIKGADVDMARIRVNNSQWDTDTIATKFNQEKNIFYREYQISTSEAYLKIEAQLHSATEGWLGD